MNALIDYLTMSSKIHNRENFIDYFGLRDVDWIETSGRYGWRDQIFYRGVHFYFGGSRDDFCIELSGTGCRTIEEFSSNSFDWFSFFRMFDNDFVSGDCNISRLDIAADDSEGVLDFPTIFRFCNPRLKKYVCKASFCTRTDGSEEHIYFGSPSSDRRLRIYNKALEQGIDGEHWLRVEMQLRNKPALSFLFNWFGTRDIGRCYSGVLRDYLRFTSKSSVRAARNNHQSRLEIVSWWDDFLGEVEALSQLYVDGGHYDLNDVEYFIRRQTSSSLKLWLEAHNGDMTDLLDIIDHARLNKRQSMLLSDLRRDMMNKKE